MATRNGFTPSRQPATDWIRNMPVGGAGQPVAKGDAVNQIAGTCFPVTAGQDPATQGYGVVLAVYTTANRPLTFNNTKFIASGTPGRADICFDPDQTYVVRCETSVGPGDVGKNVTVSAAAANSLTGLSGMSVQIPSSASTNDLFKIINVSPFDELSGKGTGAAAGQGVEVRWNRHVLKAPVSPTA